MKLKRPWKILTLSKIAKKFKGKKIEKNVFFKRNAILETNIHTIPADVNNLRGGQILMLYGQKTRMKRLGIVTNAEKKEMSVRYIKKPHERVFSKIEPETVTIEKSFYMDHHTGAQFFPQEVSSIDIRETDR